MLCRSMILEMKFISNKVLFQVGVEKEKESKNEGSY